MNVTLLGKKGLLEHRHTRDLTAGPHVTEGAKWLTGGGTHGVELWAGNEACPWWDRTGWSSGITLLRMAPHLTLMNCLFLEFSI